MFLDESGSSKLNCEKNGDDVLCIPGIIISETNFKYIIEPQFNNFKMDVFGSHDVVLHGSDIKYRRKYFEFLETKNEKSEKFYSGLEILMSGCPYRIIGVYIDKKRHCEKYIDPFDPYELALEFLFEKFEKYLQVRNAEGGELIAESRGKKEDDALHKRAISMLKYGSRYNEQFTLISGLKFEPKKANNVGLQIADLVANPLMKKIKYPEKQDYAFEIFKKRIYYSDFYGPGNIIGTGIKIFPSSNYYTDDMFM